MFRIAYEQIESGEEMLSNFLRSRLKFQIEIDSVIRELEKMGSYAELAHYLRRKCEDLEEERFQTAELLAALQKAAQIYQKSENRILDNLEGLPDEIRLLKYNVQEMFVTQYIDRTPGFEILNGLIRF